MICVCVSLSYMEHMMIRHGIVDIMLITTRTTKHLQMRTMLHSYICNRPKKDVSEDMSVYVCKEASKGTAR